MAQRPEGYRGDGFSLRGEKDRFVLPPLFRKVWEDRGDERILCVAKHHEYPCLTAFGLSRTAEFEDILDKAEDNAVRRNLDFDRDRRSTKMWTFAEVPFDASGRFILPARYCKIGGISDNICFLGGGKFITLWDLDRLGGMGSDWADEYELCLANAEEARAKAAGKSGSGGKGA